MAISSQQLEDDSVTKDMVIALLLEAAQGREKEKQRADRLAEQNAWLKRQIFGRSSEKTPKDEVNPDQHHLFNEAEIVSELLPTANESVTIPAHIRKKKGRKRIPADLPRVDIIHDLPEHEKICGNDGTFLKRIGEITSEQLDYIPAKLRVLRHIRYKYACGCCGETMKTADKPNTLLPKSLATPSLLAHITTAKYVDGLPLHRQERQFARLGIELNRATMASWMIKIGGTHVQPLINLLNDECRNSRLLHMDETRVQVLKSHKAPSADHWVWVRATGATDRCVVLFDYDASRAKNVAQRLLEGFQGILVSDGYKGYDSIAKAQGLVHAGCLAHARRKFHDAKKSAGHDDSRAKVALDYIGQLYALERKLREAQPPPGDQAILDFREKHALPVLQAFRAWLDDMALKVPPNNDLGRAVLYTLGQWCKLSTFLDHACVPLDNNRAEGCIRPFVIGRRNWVFCDTQNGATASANLYSLVESAKANGLEPHAYLTRVYSRLPLATCVEDFEALLPWNITT